MIDKDKSTKSKLELQAFWFQPISKIYATVKLGYLEPSS